MWNNIGNFGSLTKILAEKAAAAAENIEGQLNQSVGASPEILREASNRGRSDKNAGNVQSFPTIDETAISDDEDPFNEDDGFYKEDSFDVDMHDKSVNDSTTTSGEKNDTGPVEEDRAVLKDSTNDYDNQQDHAQKEEDTPQSQDSDEPKMNLGTDGFDDDEVEIEETQVDPVGIDEENDLHDEQNYKETGDIELDVNELDSTDPIEKDQEKVSNQGILGGANEPCDDNSVHSLDCATATLIHESSENSGIDSKLQIDVCPTQAPMEGSVPKDDTLENPKDSQPNSYSPRMDNEKCVTVDDIENEVSSGVYAEESAVQDTKYEDISESNSEESIYVSKEEAMTMNPRLNTEKMFQSQIEELKSQLQQREMQLASKSNQLSEIMELHEKEKAFLEAKLKETKDEAKKRITKAREKVDDMKAKLAEVNDRANHMGSESSEQEKIIQELRKEGEELAKKQSEMEQLVREARVDMRDLKNELEAEKIAKQKAEESIQKLERDLKDTKAELLAAKQKLGLTDKLESDLLTAKEEREKKSSVILGLEAKLKESLSRNSQLQKEMEQALKEKVVELEKETSSIRNEKDSILQDLESKLRVSEREASLREDSLRHEVSELRKRWQEAVRRCDALSMDLQQSSAPLLRQLESAERQSRARATAWAELENKLRADLEQFMLENENSVKEKKLMEAEISKLRVSIQGLEAERDSNVSKVKELSSQLDDALKKHDEAITESDNLKQECEELESRLKKSESRIQAEILENAREHEERYKDLTASLELQLQQEREYRASLEKKIQDMVRNDDFIEKQEVVVAKSPQRNLSNVIKQADILNDALQFMEDSDDEGTDHQGKTQTDVSGVSESFAFIEQLSQALKITKLERDALRKQLVESEERRSIIEKELVKAKDASEALREIELKMSHLNREVEEKDMEIKALQEDINDVKQMYRDQIRRLLDGDNVPASTRTQEVTTKVVETSKIVPTSFPGMRSF